MKRYKTKHDVEYSRRMNRCVNENKDLFEAGRHLAKQGDYEGAQDCAIEAIAKVAILQATKAYIDPIIEKSTRESCEDYIDHLKGIYKKEMVLY